jgi:hypothetical protein
MTRVLLVKNIYAGRINDEYSNVSLLRCVDNRSIYMRITETIADDQQPRRTGQVIAKLPVIPVQKRVLADLHGFVSTHDDQPSATPAAARPVRRSM